GREHGEGPYEAGGALAQEQPGGGAEERKDGNEGGESRRGHAVASAFSSTVASVRSSARSVSLSTSELPRLRYTSRTIARPMPISAAAMVIVNSVSAWPACRVSRSQTSKATR